MTAWHDALASHAEALLRLSYSCNQADVAEEIRRIAHALSALAGSHQQPGGEPRSG